MLVMFMPPTQKWLYKMPETLYTRRNEGTSIWVVESKNIIASNPDESEAFFDPANDKIYRHPTFYDLPDGVKHI